MKSTWLLAVGIAIGILGTSTYLSVSNQSRTSDGSSLHQMGSPDSTAGREARSHKPLWPRSKLTRAVAHEVASPPAERFTEITRPQELGSRPNTDGVNPTREELAIAAERINQHATRKLARLAHLLDLSEAQQDQVFPLLARSAPAYHPSLAIEVGGATVAGRRDPPSSDSPDDERAEEQVPAGSSESNDPLPTSKADEEIHDVLTSEQQRKLEDELIEEDLWWTEIIADLEDELDESPPAAAPMEPEPVDTNYQGNTGIGGLLQQAAEQEAPAGSGSGTPATENPSAGRARGF